MDAYYFTFHSMTQAQTAASLLQRYGISAKFLRAPKAISSTGCGYAVQTGLNNAYDAINILRHAGVIPRRIFRTAGSGNIMEVSL